jgi:ABC-type glutathione transport system ATPase component
MFVWLLAQVMPKTYGQVLRPWFFLQPSYWRGGSKHSHNATPPNTTDSSSSAREAHLRNSQHITAKDTASCCPTEAYVDVVGLGKTYVSPDGSSRVAVQGLTLQLAAGRVAALLGRNGAGKSTVMHMLTGVCKGRCLTCLGIACTAS